MVMRWFRTPHHIGGMLEWFNRLVSKTSVPKGTVGSNPTPAAVSILSAIDIDLII